MKTPLILLSLAICVASCKDVQKETSPKSINESETSTSEDSVFHEDPISGTEEAGTDEITEELPEFRIYSNWFTYITSHFDSTGISIKEIGSSAYGGEEICRFEQTFETGIFYSFKGCGEGGDSEEIIFPNRTKTDLYNMINTHFFIEENTWNDDSTSYEADGAGCYYSLIITEDTVTVSTYCGC